jgi:hypothetical protein
LCQFLFTTMRSQDWSQDIAMSAVDLAGRHGLPSSEAARDAIQSIHRLFARLYAAMPPMSVNRPAILPHISKCS